MPRSTPRPAGSRRALTEKSLLLNDGDIAPRYRMSGTIKEYAGRRLAEAGELDLARGAHLACFTELAETADPQLGKMRTMLGQGLPSRGCRGQDRPSARRGGGQAR